MSPLLSVMCVSISGSERREGRDRAMRSELLEDIAVASVERVSLLVFILLGNTHPGVSSIGF